jgi:hypothetical protein
VTVTGLLETSYGQLQSVLGLVLTGLVIDQSVTSLNHFCYSLDWSFYNSYNYILVL